MSDPIKAALREAGEAAWQRMDQLGYETPESVEAKKIAAAAVAAFLRALPDQLTFGVPTKMLSDNQLHNIAVAVERAAREDGE